MPENLTSTHRTVRQLVKYDLREWARDVATMAPTGISPLEAVRQLALTQTVGRATIQTPEILERDPKTGEVLRFRGRVQQHAVETRQRRQSATLKPPITLPPPSRAMDTALRKVRKIDKEYHQVLWHWAALGTVRRVACELDISREITARRFEGGLGALIVLLDRS